MKRVLILEDSVIVSKLLASLLKAKGFEVTECESVSQAKSNLKGLDLAILDYQLPDGTGLEIAEELKRNRPDIPIFLLTARGSHVSEDMASKAGIKKYLEKPIDPEILMEHIDEFLMSQE